jgi:hypothetical protein
VSRLLDIPEWLLANFADERYPYGLTPSVRGGKGRGKKGLYSLGDVYKIAVAHRLLAAGFASSVVAEALKELFPRKVDPIQVSSRGSVSTALDARYILLDFSQAHWADQGKLPKEWRTNGLQQQHWAHLVPRAFLADAWRTATLRASFAMPFDELLDWVDFRILGREITLRVRAAESEQKHKGHGEQR